MLHWLSVSSKRSVLWLVSVRMAACWLWLPLSSLVLIQSVTFGVQINTSIMTVYKSQRPTEGSLVTPNFTITIREKQSSLGCVLRCVENKLCGSVVYEAGTRQCTLLAEYHSELTFVSDSTSEYFSKDPCAGFSLYSKSDWGALPPEGTPGALDTPVSYVVLHSGAAERSGQWPGDCGDLNTCFSTLRDMQYYDMFDRTNTWSEIGENFYLDASGRVYEGRGWTRNSAYLSETSRGGTSGYGKHLAITMLGDFVGATPSLQSRASLRALCACAVEAGYLTQNYTVLGHVEDRPASTYCPGPVMLDMIHQWPSL